MAATSASENPVPTTNGSNRFSSFSPRRHRLRRFGYGKARGVPMWMRACPNTCHTPPKTGPRARPTLRAATAHPPYRACLRGVLPQHRDHLLRQIDEKLQISLARARRLFRHLRHTQIRYLKSEPKLNSPPPILPRPNTTNPTSSPCLLRRHPRAFRPSAHTPPRKPPARRHRPTWSGLQCFKRVGQIHQIACAKAQQLAVFDPIQRADQFGRVAVPINLHAKLFAQGIGTGGSDAKFPPRNRNTKPLAEPANRASRGCA